MPTELYENLEAPKKAVLAAVDTGEYDVETSLEELRQAGENGRLPGGGYRYPKAAKSCGGHLYGQRPTAGAEGVPGSGGGRPHHLR